MLPLTLLILMAWGEFHTAATTAHQHTTPREEQPTGVSPKMSASQADWPQWHALPPTAYTMRSLLPNSVLVMPWSSSGGNVL